MHCDKHVTDLLRYYPNVTRPKVDSQSRKEAQQFESDLLQTQNITSNARISILLRGNEKAIISESLFSTQVVSSQ